MIINLDKHIQDVSKQGLGSQKIIPIEIRSGNLKVENNSLTWVMDSEAEIVSPNTKLELGNLVIKSEANVKTNSTNETFILIKTRASVLFTPWTTTQGSILSLLQANTPNKTPKINISTTHQGLKWLTAKTNALIRTAFVTSVARSSAP